MSKGRILVIRRDNIGDLVCTTPLLRALREHYPEHEIVALANSYNAPILWGNPCLDTLLSYTKFKHRPHDMSWWRYIAHRIGFYRALRRGSFDYVILAGSSFNKRVYRLAASLNFKHLIGYSPEHDPVPGKLDKPVRPPDSPIHEARYTLRLLEAMDIHEEPAACEVYADPDTVTSLRRVRKEGLAGKEEPTHWIGIHISARKPSNRWPAERFIELITALHKQTGSGFLLFWAPGPAANPKHPGDDEKAHAIIRACTDLPLVPIATERLEELVAGLSLCDELICSDGGAMHIAAGLGKPILCFFGQSNAVQWHPWSVRHELLQPPSMLVADIRVEDALAAYKRLSMSRD